MLKFIKTGCFSIILIASIIFIYGVIHFSRKKPEVLKMQYTDTLDNRRKFVKYDWDIGKYIYQDSKVPVDTIKYHKTIPYHLDSIENAIQEINN